MESAGGIVINAYETEDGVVFDMSQLECDALRSYADGLLTDPEHPFVELLRSQGLVVGDAPAPHLAALVEAFSQATKVLTAWVVAPAGCRRVTFFVGPHSAAVLRCDDGGLYAGEDDPLTVWSIDAEQLREIFLELSALGEPSGEGIVATAVPEVTMMAGRAPVRARPTAAKPALRSSRTGRASPPNTPASRA